MHNIQVSEKKKQLNVFQFQYFYRLYTKNFDYYEFISDIWYIYLNEQVIYIIIVLRKDEFCVPGRKSMNFWKT